MSTTDPQALTQATYDRLAGAWSSSYEQADQFWGPELKRFNKLLPSGHILEIGFGGGRDAEELVKLGYKYTGIDNSPDMVKIAQQHHSKLNLLVGSVLDLDFLKGRKFDGFWAAAVLLHLPKKNVGRALQQIHSVIKPGGVGLITLRLGSGEGLRQTTKHGMEDKRYFAYYQPEEFKAILASNGYSAMDITSRAEGTEYTWLAFCVKVT